MSTQPIEDIHAIASRFQAWVGAQPGTYKDGVRELTYEEVVLSKGLRAKSETAMTDVAKPKAASGERRRKTNKSQKSKRRTATPHHSRNNPSKKSQAISPAAALEPSTFRQALTEQVSILPATANIEPRTTALSMRISSAEHALLRRRAAEANISVSCYLRKCVFEVESLRAQLACTIAEQEITHRNSAFSSCMQVMRRLFFRKLTALAPRV
jgi:hypothetical protein